MDIVNVPGIATAVGHSNDLSLTFEVMTINMT